MRNLLFLTLILCTHFLYAQELTITGYVKDAQGNAVENAVVSVKGTGIKTKTDAAGKYTIVAKEGDIILVTHLNSPETKVVVGRFSLTQVGETNTLDITLAAEQDIFDMSLEELLDVAVFTATKTSQSFAETPATMYVITEQMIKERGYFNLEEVLHDLPGFDFNKNFGVNYSTIFMRGFRSTNSDRFVLLFDGINENDIWKQTTWISRQYPVSQIKQIEVLYGPASALYGTNAFSGIINVITKKGENVGSVNSLINIGSWGQKNIEWATGKNVNSDFSYNITAKYHSQNDLHDWDLHNAITGDNSNFTQEYLNNIGNKLIYNIDGKLVPGNFDTKYPSENYSIHANVQLGDLKFTALNWTKKELEAYFYSPFKRSGPWTQWFENNMAYMLSHDAELSSKLNLSTSLTFRSHNIIDSKEGSFKYLSAPLTDVLNVNYAHSQSIIPTNPSTYQLVPRSVTLANGTPAWVTATIYHYDLNAWDIALEQQLTANISEKLNIIGGAKYTYTNTQEDYNIGEYTYKMVTTPRHLKKTMAGYAQAIYKPFEKLSLTIGGRIEDQKDENNVGYTVFTPRLSALFKVTDAIILRMQYAEAFQEADDWHKFATDFDVRPFNSSHLEPEKLQSVEFGTTFKFADKLMISTALYHSIVSNFITEVANTVQNPYHGFTYGIHYDNNKEGDMTIYGYEVSFNAFLSSSLSINGNVSGAYNYEAGTKMEQDASGNFQPITDSNGNKVIDEKVLIGDIAPIKANLGLLYVMKDKFSVYPKVNFVGVKKTINWRANLNTPMFREIDTYTILGLNLLVNNTFGLVKGLDFNLKLDNLLNSEYYNPGSRSADGYNYTARVLQPGFNFMTGFSYKF